MEYKISAIIVDPDPEPRMRLKLATRAVPQFQKVFLESELRSATSKMESGEIFDVVFVSERFSHEDVMHFIKTSKEKAEGQDTAYVLVLGSTDQNSSKIASSMVVGADGFLLEPYSVDSLVEIVKLAEKIKGKHADERERVAVGFVVSDIMTQLDRVAYIKSCKSDITKSLDVLKAKCEVFKGFDEDKLSMYYSAAEELFIKAELPQKGSMKFYKGVSKRVKKMMEAKIQAELEAEENKPEKED